MTEERHSTSPAELKAQLAAERAGVPFVVYRAPDGQRILTLGSETALIGRDGTCDVSLPWDDQVSRLHAELVCLRGHRLVVDDGLSRNGTFLNGDRVEGRRRLRPGDRVRVGSTVLTFREPLLQEHEGTAVPERVRNRVELSPAQRRVLVALCRPVQEGGALAAPATNQEIADAIHLSLPAVKTHLRLIAQRLGLGDLPQNAKRAQLARIALELELVTPADLRRPA